MGLSRNWFRPAWVLFVGMVVGIAPGCVHRRMTIRSNPPGAVVYVDDYEVGTTPVSADFTYYGTRKVRLVKDGCETLTVMQKVRTPWYQVPPLDFFSENLWPCKIRDHQEFTYQLAPQMVVPTEQLLSRAEGLRARAQVSAAPEPVPLPPEAVPPPLPQPAPGSPGTTPGPPAQPYLNPAPDGTPLRSPDGEPIGTPIPQPPAFPPGGYPVYPLPR